MGRNCPIQYPVRDYLDFPAVVLCSCCSPSASSFSIPFAVTEYAEQSADQTATNLPIMRGAYAQSLEPGSREYDQLMRPRSCPITVNPFHRPGQRPLPVVRMPNLYNGFVIPVTTKPNV